MKILDINALQILDSRGNPTLEVEVLLEDGSKGDFKVPSGASTGIHEAVELRDNDKNIFFGKSVFNAVKNVSKIKKLLIGIDLNQKKLDDLLIELDGTKNKSNLGSNTILGISIAYAKACAVSKGISLHLYLSKLIEVSFENKSPNLFANVLNGGVHCGNDLMVQEFMIVPFLDSLQDNIRAISEIYQVLKSLISDKYGASQIGVGDEGGFAPNLSKSSEALDLLVRAIKETNYEQKVFLAMDAAASEFYDKDLKLYEIEKGVKLNYKDLVKYYQNLCKNYPLISIEDPFAEDDFNAFSYYMRKGINLSFENPLINENKLLVVGDDLLVTNVDRIQISKDKFLCNSLLLKINQIGTLSQSIDAYNLAKSDSWQVIVSHRSGETEDSFISDFAAAMQDSIKLGAPCRGERVAKYNRLLKIFRN